MNTKEIPHSVVCDIDGVLGDATPEIVKSINKEFGTTYTREDWINWDWALQILQLLSHMNIKDSFDWLFSIEHYSLSIPLSSAQDVLQHWHEQGAHIAVATTRPPESQDVTRQWLSENYPFIKPQDIYIRTDPATGGWDHKISVVETLKPDLYFEDEPNLVLKLINRWSTRLGVLRVIDQPWNRNIQELDPFRTKWEFLKK